MRVGWIFHRLTKKELCHANETWHALNLTVTDTNCIQINPHLISTSGLWKVLLKTFQNSRENWRRGSYFTRTMLLHTRLWLESLLCVTLNWFITHHILLIWHHLTICCSPTWKTLRWEAVSDRWWGHISSWGLFPRIRMRAFIIHGSPSAATPMEDVFGTQGRLCWKQNYIWSNSIIAS